MDGDGEAAEQAPAARLGAGRGRRRRRGGRGRGDAHREVVLDGVERRRSSPPASMRRERDDRLLAGQAVVVRADPALRRAAGPRRPARSSRSSGSRAREAPVVALGVDGHLVAVARGGGRRARAAVGPRRVARDQRARRPRTRTPRASACGGSGSATTSSAPSAALEPHRSGPSGPGATATAPSADVRRARRVRRPAPGPGGGERGERQLGLAPVLAGAERRAQRRGAVAPQHELGRASPVAPTTSARPSWISTRRATASAVPPAATRPSVPASAQQLRSPQAVQASVMSV